MSEIAMVARCTICQKPFAGPMFSKIGLKMDAVNNRLAVFTEKLTRHLFEAHPEVAEAVKIQGAEYMGALFLSKFSSGDENLAMQVDVSRWKVLQNVLSCRFSDGQILAVVEKVVPELLTLADARDVQTLTRNLCGLLASMRDKLEEPGKYNFIPMDISLTGTSS